MASYWPPFQNPTEDAYCISFKYSQAVTRAPHHHTVGLNASVPVRRGRRRAGCEDWEGPAFSLWEEEEEWTERQAVFTVLPPRVCAHHPGELQMKGEIHKD